MKYLICRESEIVDLFDDSSNSTCCFIQVKRLVYPSQTFGLSKSNVWFEQVKRLFLIG
jgi:hypothetical protein